MNVGALGLGALALEGGADDRMGEAERVTTLEHSRSRERVGGSHRLPGADTGELDRVPELGAVTQPGYGAGKLERVRAEAPQSHVNARGDGPGRELEDGRPPRVVRPHSACGEVRSQRIEQEVGFRRPRGTPRRTLVRHPESGTRGAGARPSLGGRGRMTVVEGCVASSSRSGLTRCAR